MNFSETRCTQRDTMLWRRPKRALRLVRFSTGRGLAARWEWRMDRESLRCERCSGLTTDAPDPRSSAEQIQTRSKAKSRVINSPRKRVQRRIAGISPSFYILETKEWVCSFWHTSQQRTVADTPSISMHWNARSFNISSRKTREFTSRAFFERKSKWNWTDIFGSPATDS